MTRRLAWSIPLVLTVAIAAAWFRTLRVADQITLLTHGDTQYCLSTHPHGVELCVTTNFRSHPPTWNPVSPFESWHEGWSYSTHPWGVVAIPPVHAVPSQPGDVVVLSEAWAFTWSPPEHHLLGAGYESSSEAWTSPAGQPLIKRTTLVAVPLWLIVVLLWLPLFPRVLRQLIRHRRAGNQRCPACGYDLRATPSRCPECGFARGRAIGIESLSVKSDREGNGR